MATRTRAAETERWRTRGHTTIELRRNERGEWLATQRGVAVEGRGSSAAAAAAAYCEAIDADGDGPGNGDG